MEAIEFMDPKRRRRHDVMLLVGYVLVGCAILLITVILLFVAYGFGVKNGRVIQNGLLFISSTPNPAQIYMDGTHYPGSTNTKLVLQAGTYAFDLKRTGYRDWQRSIVVEGGQVESYTYPFLFPVTLTASTRQDYTGTPSVITESPDHRWLAIAEPGNVTVFDVYDLNNPQRAPSVVSLPADLLTVSGTSLTVQVTGWSDDNDHVLLAYTVGSATNYILMSRSSPTQSVNLTKTFALAPGEQLQLSNKRADQFIAYNPATHALARMSLSAPQPQPYVQLPVLAYATYGDNTLLYVTPDVSVQNKVDVDLYDGSNTYLVRRVAANTNYVLNLAVYSGDLYAAVAVASEHMGYLYLNPASQITNAQIGVAVPVYAFRLASPDYIAFSPNSQYVLFESGGNFAVYDAENEQAYTYGIPDTLDVPQVHAYWMDNARLMYVSHGQVVVADFDGQNRQVLVSADPRYEPIFDQNYKIMYALVPSASDSAHWLLVSTPLRTPADQ